MTGGRIDIGERIVAASIEHDNAHPGRQCSQCIHDIVEPDGLQRDIGFTLRIDIYRHEIVLAIDLQSVAGIEQQRHGVRAARGHFGREIAHGLTHVVLRKVGSRCHFKASAAE